MTVAELIKKLNECPMDALVVAEKCTGAISVSTFYKEIVEVHRLAAPLEPSPTSLMYGIETEQYISPPKGCSRYVILGVGNKKGKRRQS
jgi:hypothetical protein